jgi:2-polyprenyl-3-methyl-5-hydroxy-6-metoxy-1,4-benzoquinol methylase
MYVDASLVLGVELSPEDRWAHAHRFHTSWKGSQQELYGPDGYNDRIDSKSREVLTEFYEVGLDFKGKTFLDVGCGTRGVLPIITAEKKIGVDPTIFKVKHSYAFDEIDVYYLSEKVEDLSLKDNSVDVVCCNNTLNHVEDPLKALSLSVAKVLEDLQPTIEDIEELFENGFTDQNNPVKEN